MFVEEYLRELRRAGFTPRAGWRYVVRCARLSLEAASARPHAVRGIALAGLGHLLALFVAATLLSFLVDRGLAVDYLVRSGAWLAGGLLWISLHLGMFREDTDLPRSGLGLPNFLTLSRLVCIPAFQLFLTRGHTSLALAALVLGGLSDVADGIAARSSGTVTRLGRVFDPLVDILFTAMVAVTLTQTGLLPGWILALVLLRYGLLLVGAAVIYVVRGPVRVQPTVLGKATGLVTIGLLVGILLVHGFLPAPLEEQALEVIHPALALILALTVIQVVIIGVYNIRHLGETASPDGALSLVVGGSPSAPPPGRDAGEARPDAPRPGGAP
jgi:cardiolipin synthase